jgi:hypothetical protein
MKAKKIFAIFGTVALLALLWVASGVVAGPPAEGPEGEGEVTIASTVSSKISYQGVLKKNDQPVTGSRDMTFRLYSDSACTTQVGSDIVKSGVQVTNGLFSVDLDVAHGHFNGQGLWLEVEVGGTKIGCQEILPVPYALSLRPGAYIEGSVSGGPILYAKNESSADDSKGVYGYASATSGETYGVYGESDSNTGIGVYGKTGAGTGVTWLNVGVWGDTDSGRGVVGSSRNGTGVAGYAIATSGENYGIFGQSASTSGRGVYGYASATSGTTYGVYGKSLSSDGYGVYGTAPTTGTVGIATATSGETYGVYGETRSTTYYAAGVYGYATATSGETSGVYGRSDSPDGFGVYGESSSGIGVLGKSSSSYGGCFSNFTTDYPTLKLFNGALYAGDLIEAYNRVFGVPPHRLEVQGAR